MAGANVTDEATLAARGALAGARRRWTWIAVATLAGAVASAAFVSVAPQRYAASAVIVAAGPPPFSASGSGTPDDTEARAQALRSPDVARAAIDRLRLAADPEFRGEDAADGFLSRLSVSPVTGSRAIRIAFQARDPELAARAANTVAELAVQSLDEARARSVRAVEARLGKTIEDAGARVADAEAKVEAERLRTAPPASAAGQGADETDLEAKLSAARVAAATAAGKAAELRKLAQEGRLADAPPSVADDPLRRLLDQRASIRAEIADASRTLLPLHPRMKDLAAELAAVDGEIRNAAERETRASEAEARRAADEADALAAALAERSKAAAAASVPPASASALHALEREAQTAREALQAYRQMAREQETREAAEAETGSARIIARAQTPRSPVFPRAAPTLAIGTAAGFGLGCLAAALAALAASRRRPPGAATPPLDLATPEPAAAAARPEAASGPSDVPEPFAQGAPAGALDDVATLVATLRRLKPTGNLVVLVAGDESGRALAVALETARRFAAARATAFIDLGKTQAWLADILHRDEDAAPAIPGLSDLVAGRAGFGEVIRRDLSSTLDVVLAGGNPGSGALDNALTAFAASYGAVVLHASDWRSAWARAASGAADAVAVVAPAARAASARARAASALGEACPTVLAFAVRAARTAPEPVG